jgi:hypothetical protein
MVNAQLSILNAQVTTDNSWRSIAATKGLTIDPRMERNTDELEGQTIRISFYL